MDICNIDSILNINNPIDNEYNDEKIENNDEKIENDYDILEHFDKSTNYEQYYCKDHDGFIAIDIIKNKDKNNVSPDKSIFLMINNNLIPSAKLISEIYQEHSDEDGFLYVFYDGESTFG